MYLRWSARVAYRHTHLSEGAAYTTRTTIVVNFAQISWVYRGQAMQDVRAAVLSHSTWSFTGITHFDTEFGQRTADCVGRALVTFVWASQSCRGQACFGVRTTVFVSITYRLWGFRTDTDPLNLKMKVTFEAFSPDCKAGNLRQEFGSWAVLGCFSSTAVVLLTSGVFGIALACERGPVPGKRGHINSDNLPVGAFNSERGFKTTTVAAKTTAFWDIFGSPTEFEPLEFGSGAANFDHKRTVQIL